MRTDGLVCDNAKKTIESLIPDRLTLGTNVDKAHHARRVRESTTSTLHSVQQYKEDAN